MLRIAPGAGGKRRRTAIGILASKGLIRIVEATTESVTISRPSI